LRGPGDLSYASIARLHKCGTDLDGRRDVHDRLLAIEDMDSLTAVLSFAEVMLEETTRCADDLDNFAGQQNWRDPVTCGTCSISAGTWRRRRRKGGIGGSRPDHRNDTKQSPAPGTRNESVIPLAGGAQMTPVGSLIAIGWRHPSPNPPGGGASRIAFRTATDSVIASPSGSASRRSARVCGQLRGLNLPTARTELRGAARRRILHRERVRARRSASRVEPRIHAHPSDWFGRRS